ncbi:MAG: hypothetical protein WCK42_09500, partial [Myxococcaceae bacterium]
VAGEGFRVRSPRLCKSSNEQKMVWFRNLPGSEPFGIIDAKTCSYTSPNEKIVPLDYSLQMSVAWKNYASGAQFNPCKSSVDTTNSQLSLSDENLEGCHESSIMSQCSSDLPMTYEIER